MGISLGLRKKDKRIEIAESPPTPAIRTESRPPLLMLIPDASGVASYQLNEFPTATAAEFFLDSALRGMLHEGTVLFWALSWQPDDHKTEPLVLIRDAQTGIAYPFSYATIDAAYDFLRQEMNRGLAMEQVSVYWASPACIELDFWGRSTVTPSQPPKHPQHEPIAMIGGSVELRAPVQRYGERSPDEAYLTEADIAHAVDAMNTASQDGPEPTANVIDFPSASQKLLEGKHARAAINAWANASLAIDEALDVYVAGQVRIKLAWNRILRALGEAVHLRRVIAAQNAWRIASAALADAVPAVSTQRREVAIRRGWLNIAWTLEEAVYAHALEQRSRSIRGWRFAAMAIAEALVAHSAYESKMRNAWISAGVALELACNTSAEQAESARVRVALRNLGTALEEAVEAHAYRAELMTAWSRIAIAIEEALEEKTRADAATFARIKAWATFAEALQEATEVYAQRRALSESWENAGCALEEAVAAFEHQHRLATGWQNATLALTEALVAEAKLRIAQANLDKTLIAEVEKTVKARIGIKSNKSKSTKNDGDLPAPLNDTPLPEELDPKDENHSPAEPEQGAETTDEETPEDAFPTLWRTHDTDRWRERGDEPFRGFDSPPGRF